MYTRCGTLRVRNPKLLTRTNSVQLRPNHGRGKAGKVERFNFTTKIARLTVSRATLSTFILQVVLRHAILRSWHILRSDPCVGWWCTARWRLRLCWGGGCSSVLTLRYNPRIPKPQSPKLTSLLKPSLNSQGSQNMDRGELPVPSSLPTRNRIWGTSGACSIHAFKVVQSRLIRLISLIAHAPTSQAARSQFRVRDFVGLRRWFAGIGLRANFKAWQRKFLDQPHCVVFGGSRFQFSCPKCNPPFFTRSGCRSPVESCIIFACRSLHLYRKVGIAKAVLFIPHPDRPERQYTPGTFEFDPRQAANPAGTQA